MRRDILLNETFHSVALQRTSAGARLWLDDTEHEVCLRDDGEGEFHLVLDGCSHRVSLASRGDTVYLHAFGRSWELAVVDPLDRAGGHGGADANAATAPMPGVVVAVDVTPGDEVHKGQTLVTIESMKLETAITAWRDGTVEAVHLAEGASFDKGAKLVSLHGEGSDT
jgi:acetyl/propionyl-CoA carboxylase alpha subunit